MKTVATALAIFCVVAMGSAQKYVEGTPTPGDRAELKKHETSYKTAKAAYAKTKNAKTKKAYVDATVRFGTASMTSPVLDRKVKYKNALALYREALKLDPKNAEAKNNTEMIVEIYKSMGRPIPK